MGEEATMRDELNAAYDDAEAELDEEEDTGGGDDGTVNSSAESGADNTDNNDTSDSSDSDTTLAADSKDGDKDSGDDKVEPKDDDKTVAKDTKLETKDEKEGDFKPPMDYTPELREQWKNVPKAVQERILSREHEIAVTMKGTAEARRTHTQLGQLAQGYATVLAAEGANSPMEAVDGLFKTAAQLRLGSPAQKATRLAGLIKHYDIDVEILDQVLSGEAPSTEEDALSKMLDTKLAPMQEMLDQYRNNEQRGREASRTEVKSEVVGFADGKEFINDVRFAMADIIDMATKQNRAMTLDEAYNMACQLNPQVKSVMDQRAAQTKLEGDTTRLQGKKNAGSSLPVRSASTSSPKGDQSLRDTIAELYDDAV